MTDRPVELWFFHPEGNSPVVSQAKQLIREECEKRQWTQKERPTPTNQTGRKAHWKGKARGCNKSVQTNSPGYGWVWQIDHADVPKRPQPQDNPAHYTTLRTFVLHKAYHNTLDSKSLKDSWASSLREFLTWVDRTHCEDEGDPRCLPFHVFSTRFKLEHLNCEVGRQDFATTHGPQSSRLDGRDLRWMRGAFHGREALQVAGRELAAGFHWDVSGGRKQQIVTPSAVWQLKPNGYVNLYPDAHVRGYPNTAKRIHPRN